MTLKNERRSRRQIYALELPARRQTIEGSKVRLTVSKSFVTLFLCNNGNKHYFTILETATKPWQFASTLQRKGSNCELICLFSFRMPFWLGRYF